MASSWICQGWARAGDKILELWDLGQPVPADSPNRDGMFQGSARQPVRQVPSHTAVPGNPQPPVPATGAAEGGGADGPGT